MALSANSKLLNIKRSFNKWLHIKLVEEPSTPRCFINYGEIEGAVPKGTDRWITVFWLNFSGGIFTHIRVQLNIMSKIQNDQYGNKVSELADYLTEALNYNTIPLYDFADPQNTVDLTPYCLIPRYDDSGSLDFPDGTPNRGFRSDYLIHMSRDGILP
jgi:hypothetical protein